MQRFARRCSGNFQSLNSKLQLENASLVGIGGMSEHTKKRRRTYAEVEWRALRLSGVPAGSQCRKMAELRAKLIANGLWWVIYEDN